MGNRRVSKGVIAPINYDLRTLHSLEEVVMTKIEVEPLSVSAIAKECGLNRESVIVVVKGLANRGLAKNVGIMFCLVNRRYSYHYVSSVTNHSGDVPRKPKPDGKVSAFNRVIDTCEKKGILKSDLMTLTPLIYAALDNPYRHLSLDTYDIRIRRLWCSTVSKVVKQIYRSWHA